MPKFNYRIENLEDEIKAALSRTDSRNHTTEEESAKDFCRTTVNIGTAKEVTRGNKIYNEQHYKDPSNDYQNQKHHEVILKQLVSDIKKQYPSCSTRKATLLSQLSMIYIFQGTIAKVFANIASTFPSTNIFDIIPDSSRKIEIQEEKIIYYNSVHCIFRSGDRDNNNMSLTIGELKYTIDLNGAVSTEFSQVSEDFYCHKNTLQEEISVSDADRQMVDENLDKFIRAIMMQTQDNEPFVRIDSQLTQNQIKVLLALERLILSPDFEASYAGLDNNARPKDSYDYSQNLTDEVQSKLGGKDIKPLVALVEKNLLINTSSPVMLFWFWNVFIKFLSSLFLLQQKTTQEQKTWSEVAAQQAEDRVAVLAC
jgi:hypothetical protein